MRRRVHLRLVCQLRLLHLRVHPLLLLLQLLHSQLVHLLHLLQLLLMNPLLLYRVPVVVRRRPHRDGSGLVGHKLPASLALGP